MLICDAQAHIWAADSPERPWPKRHEPHRSAPLGADELLREMDAAGGTDLSRLPCSYRQGVTMFTEELQWLKGEDLAWVMGRGVCKWLGWKLP